MNAKRSSLKMLVLLCLLSMLSNRAFSSEHKQVYMVVWRGCEAACQGFIDYVKARNLAVNIIVKDVARNKKKLPGLIDEIKKAQADLVVTWGTSVTLGMIGALDSVGDSSLGKIPVVFMIVADPIGAKIIKSYRATGREHVTGVRNRVPEKINIKAIKTFLPTFKHLGLLYNPQEANSQLKAHELKLLAMKMQFKISAQPLTLTGAGDIDKKALDSQLAKFKRDKVDFVYLGSSSLIRKSGAMFTQAALDNQLPTLSPYEQLVRESNALFSVAAKYSDVGELAAHQMKKILFERQEPGALPVMAVKKFAYVINMKVAKALGLYPSVNILQYAETINP